MAKVTTIEIDGAKYPVDCNEYGEFGTNAEDGWITAPSLDLLTKKLLSISKRKRAHIKIPFYCDDNGKLLRGVITGIHARTNNFLVAWDTGKKDQGNYWGDYYAIDDKELPEANRLLTAATAATKAWDTFKSKHKMEDVKQRVAKAAGLEDVV